MIMGIFLPLLPSGRGVRDQRPAGWRLRLHVFACAAERASLGRAPLSRLRDTQAGQWRGFRDWVCRRGDIGQTRISARRADDSDSPRAETWRERAREDSVLAHQPSSSIRRAESGRLYCHHTKFELPTSNFFQPAALNRFPTRTTNRQTASRRAARHIPSPEDSGRR